MISGGGTSGHVYPALAVVERLTANRRPPTHAISGQRSAVSRRALAVCWVGNAGGIEEDLAARAGIPFKGISAAGLRGKNPLALLSGIWTLNWGFWQARQRVRDFRPDVLLVTGGYVCVPVTLSARMAGVPILIYLPDMEPGLAIKFLARFADRVAVTARPAAEHFRPGQALVTGYPVRRRLFEGDQREARKRLELSIKELPVLLVFGGSQGARSINQALNDGIEELLKVAQVIHISGQRDAEWMQRRRESLPVELQARYHLYDYLHEEMVDALLAADLAVSRAGASTLGEFPAAGLPSVLVPYPYAGAHQKNNADFLAKAGAAVTIADEELGTKLIPTVLNLLADGERRAAMRQAAQSLAQPDAAQRLVRQLKEMAE